jgi:hypothetical protein
VIGECWVIEEAAGHRWTETWARALQAEVVRGMLLTSRKNGNSGFIMLDMLHFT